VSAWYDAFLLDVFYLVRLVMLVFAGAHGAPAQHHAVVVLISELAMSPATTNQAASHVWHLLTQRLALCVIFISRQSTVL
jgi:hypothetical protein